MKIENIEKLAIALYDAQDQVGKFWDRKSFMYQNAEKAILRALKEIDKLTMKDIRAIDEELKELNNKYLSFLTKGKLMIWDLHEVEVIAKKQEAYNRLKQCWNDPLRAV